MADPGGRCEDFTNRLEQGGGFTNRPEQGGGILVLGLGNILMSDDGAGVEAATRLQKRFAPIPGLSIVDGGTLGLDLLPMIEDATHLLIIDAVVKSDDSQPGEIVRIDGDDISAFFSTKISPHQMGMKDLFFCARLQGRMPKHAVLLGITAGSLDVGVGLTPPVATAVDALVDAAVEELRGWGEDCL
ncbi:MAG: HyaD/HybD family hydrogenase maturation endopeptidase [Nitrospirae bacterium]|nr:HyaD/HybD family hydrogenase maturation endopeptidase [Nitrospirota bacterium]